MSVAAKDAPEPLSADEKRARMQALRWYHTLDLGDGVITPGAVPAEALAQSAKRVFKHPIAGLSVLDIGCWDGYFSFEARRRGASGVVAADHFVWDGPGWGQKAAFDLAREAIDPSVEPLVIPFEDMTPDAVGERFDIVLYLAMLYHLKDPLGAIERAAAFAERMIVVETHVDNRLPADVPAFAFYPKDEVGGDPSVWWGPNVAGLRAALIACGFSKVEVDAPYSEVFPSRCLIHAWR